MSFSKVKDKKVKNKSSNNYKNYSNKQERIYKTKMKNLRFE